MFLVWYSFTSSSSLLFQFRFTVFRFTVFGFTVFGFTVFGFTVFGPIMNTMKYSFSIGCYQAIKCIFLLLSCQNKGIWIIILFIFCGTMSYISGFIFYFRSASTQWMQYKFYFLKVLYHIYTTIFDIQHSLLHTKSCHL